MPIHLVRSIVAFTKCSPLSELILSGKPNLGITSSMKNSATTYASLFTVVVASIHLLNLSIIISVYNMPCSFLSSPMSIKSNTICPNSPSNIKIVAIGVKNVFLQLYTAHVGQSAKNLSTIAVKYGDY